MSFDSTRAACNILLVAGTLLLIFLEKCFPYTKNQKFLRDGFWTDFLLYGILQSIFLGYLISELISFIDSFTNLSSLGLISVFPTWLQVLFFLVTHDFYIYWFHRWQHNSGILWRIHEAHHSNREVDWIAGSRSHILEILINQSIEFAPIVLLGAAPEVIVIKLTIDGLWGMYIHSNINVRSGRLQWILNGPEMHRWHHADGEEKAYNKNFATKFAIWDWMFGTAFLPCQSKPDRYGITGLNFPKNYFLQQVFAFRKSDDRN